MFMGRTRHGRSIYMFYVVCRDCVNTLKLGGNAGKACDVLVPSTWGVCKLCMWAGWKHVRKEFSEQRRTAGAHCSDIGWGAYKGQNGAKMQLGVEEVWGMAIDRRWFEMCMMIRWACVWRVFWDPNVGHYDVRIRWLRSSKWSRHAI